MATKKLPCPTVVRQLLQYDPETGYFYFKHRPLCFFQGDRDRTHTQNNWNSRWSGKPAFTALANGYFHGHILWAKVRAARVAFAIMEGCWPAMIVDHINGNTQDNRWQNLREVTKQENGQNAKKPSDNTSGHIGVTWDKEHQKWRAQIRANGKTVYLGMHQNILDAVSARKDAEKRFGFHENHGR